MAEEASHTKMGFQASWAMAVGGMIGGGIFSVLGVVISVAGQWAWLSFLLGGLIALVAGHAYSKLTERLGVGGGAFTFLLEVDREGLAGSLSWILVFGYTLTLSVYAFTFGNYLGHIGGFGAWFPRVSAVVVIAILIGVNLRGVRNASGVEIVTVWGKVIVLIGLGAIGMALWQPERMTEGIQARSPFAAIEGAAAVFMAYEGFQLLAYDYGEIRNAYHNMPLAMYVAIVTVMLLYMVVTVGASMLVGAGTIVARDEVAIAVAGEAALGRLGLGLATLAAVFSTASAINATLFATARLARNVANDGELPTSFARENRRRVPYQAVWIIGGCGAVMALVGSLHNLVQGASLVFLVTLVIVNVLAFRQIREQRWLFALGVLGTGGAALFLAWRLLHQAPISLAVLGAVVLFATIGRPLMLHRRH